VPELLIVRAGRVDYHTAWDWQRALHERRVAGVAPDVALLLEHDPVYTAGRRTDPMDRPFDGTPVVDVDRGGKITWHGPGQLTGYPVVALPPLPGADDGGRADRGVPVDVVAYVRRLEEALIRVCAELGLSAGRVDGRSGVWLPADGARQERKVAAIGVRVARGVTMHGFALNADCDLGAFDRIVPCGIRDAGVTSLSAELGARVTVDDVLPLVERHLCAVLDAEPRVASLADVGLSSSSREASLV
jgi:lipoyl(octanoyl) transferase